MKPKQCPHCKQIIPPDAEIFTGKPIRQRIYDFIAKHPEGVSRKQITNHVYALDPNGGPETGDNAISVQLWHMRPRLAEMNLAIVSDNHGCTGATYKLTQR